MAAIPDESELQRSKLPERIAMQTQTSVIIKEKEKSEALSEARKRYSSTPVTTTTK